MVVFLSRTPKKFNDSQIAKSLPFPCTARKAFHTPCATSPQVHDDTQGVNGLRTKSLPGIAAIYHSTEYHVSSFFL
jgi:hypothetical protein